jgi:hypothetical protein
MDSDEEEPTLGVREPRRPKPTPRSGAEEAELVFTPEPEAEAVAQDPCVTA